MLVKLCVGAQQLYITKCCCYGFRCHVHSRKLEIKERRIVREASLDPDGYGVRDSDRADLTRERDRERDRDWHHYSKSSARSGRSGRSHRSSHGRHRSRRRSHSRHRSPSKHRSHHSDSVGRFPKHAHPHCSASTQKQYALGYLECYCGVIFFFCTGNLNYVVF